MVVPGTPIFPDGPDGIGYYRQSKTDPDGIERQREKVRKMFADMGVNLVGEYEDDDVSATKRKRRRGYEQAVAHMKKLKPGDILGVSKMARLYRKTIELEGIIPLVEQTGVMVKSVEGTYDLSTPNGRMTARILVSTAQAEVEEKADRQKGANLQAAKAGKRNRTGIRPFGYQDDRISPFEQEADAIRDACRTILAGGSLAAVVRDWTARELRPRFDGRTYTDENGNEIPFSGKWRPPTVRKILLNPHIAGQATVPGTGEILGDGNWTPIITPETWASVRSVLTDPDRKAPRGNVSLLGCLAYCKCGTRVQRATRHNRHGTVYPIYRCLEYGVTGNGNPGPHVNIKAEPVDQWIEEVIIERARQADHAGFFTRTPDQVDVAKIKKERQEISQGLEQLAGDSAMGIIPRSTYLAAAERVTRRINEIGEAIAEAGKMDAPALLLGADDPAEVWPDLDVTVQRQIIDRLMRITLTSPGRGFHNQDMNTIVHIRWRA
jgi:site-specific DNA recombinase